MRYCGPAVLLLPMLAGTAAGNENAIADKAHLGAASCASSVCHGKLARQDDSNVWLNEYRLWTGADKHSQAYRKLEGEASKKIAANLGLARATTAKVCLDCHADNVAADKRGPKFQIRDGVGCEACHGGAEEWIETHAADGATHQANLAAGMYPSESPADRAALCLSCHLGSAEKFAGHDIMGAGHPRLSFELEAFTANQPAHYEVDDDYRARKGEIPGFKLWLIGQAEAARRFADLVRQKIASGTRPYPELALYDYFACHHEMDDRRWTPTRGPEIGPGTLRIQDQHLLILQAAASVLETPQLQAELASNSQALVLGGQQDLAAARVAAGRLAQWLRSRERAWSSRSFGSDTIAAVRRTIVQQAGKGRMGDFATAEQVVMALESLSYSLGDHDRLLAALDQLFEEVADHKRFAPASFARTSRAVQGQF